MSFISRCRLIRVVFCHCRCHYFYCKDNEIFFANKNHPKKLIQFYNID
ncbi:hypothetical protein HMPREF0650_2153 [Hoylesella buccalis ATCC 35310]|uniref:Uncharacterized protein n=1 Tax=Hoylesella buccalis ATCC 35310 TaxID=679190 RepID=D1W4S5_9BACT|nr:hypothetical protein HMPREF0650_2153 [Hoylesella buccalis ATCC 35310]